LPYSGDGGTAQSATLCSSSAIAFDRSGNLFVTEIMCSCIRRVDAETGLIQTTAGTGTPGVSGDMSNDGGPATQLALTPGAIAVYGNVYFLWTRLDRVSDGPVVTGIGPAPTLNGEGLTGVATASLSMGGQPTSIQPQLQSCTSVSCSVVVNFAGMAGQYGMRVDQPCRQYFG
jgi:hypothetical protein